LLPVSPGNENLRKLPPTLEDRSKSWEFRSGPADRNLHGSRGHGYRICGENDMAKRLLQGVR
jgi:hypothetical protein